MCLEVHAPLGRKVRALSNGSMDTVLADQRPKPGLTSTSTQCGEKSLAIAGAPRK
jgi:hypothetical protein